MDRVGWGETKIVGYQVLHLYLALARWNCQANEITGHEKQDMAAAYQIFPNAQAGSLERPVRKVGIMIGQDNFSLLPWEGLGQIVLKV